MEMFDCLSRIFRLLFTQSSIVVSCTYVDRISSSTTSFRLSVQYSKLMNVCACIGDKGTNTYDGLELGSGTFSPNHEPNGESNCQTVIKCEFDRRWRNSNEVLTNKLEMAAH